MKNLLYIALFTFSTVVFGQLNPQTKNITQKFFDEVEKLDKITPGLQKENGFTNYQELHNFLNDLVKNYPSKVTKSFIGKSQDGNSIPMVILTNPNIKEKVRVFMQGGLHGDEPASTEGMLYLIKKLLNDENYNKILNDVELAVIPMANIDGYLKQNRYAKNGLDLNRDQTKIMALETVVLKNAFVNFNPHVAIDFHEYRPYRRDYAMMGDFGVAGRYDVMFLYSSNLNVPKNLRDFTENILVENARKKLSSYNIAHHPYFSSADDSGEVHINQGSLNSRSSATNFALTNTISTLVEVRGVGLGKTSYSRRVFSTFTTAISFLQTAATNKEKIKEEIQKANQQQNEVVVTHKRTPYRDKIEFIDLDDEELITLDVIKKDASKAKADLVRKRPVAYYLDESQSALVNKLKTLGVEVHQLKNDREKLAETYTISYYDKDYKKYEKMEQQDVETTVAQEKISFKTGTYVVDMNQKRANIVIELLEPEAPNSFVSFGVLPTKKGDKLPIYRILK